MRFPFIRRNGHQQPIKTDSQRKPREKDGPVQIIKAFASHNTPAMFTRWPDRHELGGDDFMLIVVRGRKLCTKAERAIRRLIKGTDQ